ncbi:MerR family transcriptional regulator [Clostridium botulinum]|uniref:MerR family transcriptional regulator n=1 Tax=Clostridium botulinum C/D str. DC5 TaxID=1443128 RepID=A0A0A0IMP1_CLOBO|nr:GyrI-like domain-containing protein [Clostridium botulinum]KEI06360.1 MerR family transcriptional regulator [Clostridium botulinum C/D str. BKT75002]KEI13724.1 MerR family transcriptional regulator [Clostridium botulinum C/D str. BKT2873]KGM96227.1 MerR family transcriptional regulator [Clostridium botulinum D str. CCUG 7971]KGN00801.1 MerR family transcriptional regulator [Clostridium botulinum C/D str. DC5]KOC46216.1 MerR family transcriptional regulator [Clostridium botulinum]
MEEELYSIGRVGEICNITKKALRYYDKMHILSPDKVADENGYRYYSKRTLLSVPMIKYYKQSGFKLEEMKTFLKGTTYDFFHRSFKKKIHELKELQKEINLKIRSVEDWDNLIVEAQMVIENKVCDVSVKYIDNRTLIFLDQNFQYDYMDSIINIEFTNYIESINNAITGPVIIRFPSFEEKMNGKCKKITIMQQTILKCKEELSTEFGGCMVVSCYHIGPHETINETYKKIKEWIKNHGYICSKESYERYVTDYWTTKNASKFVTEILIKIRREK